MAVAVPWAITQATVNRAGVVGGSRARARAFMPTLIANVVA
jgi:hypothetical protein